MQTIPRTEIIISQDRQRKEFEPVSLNELAQTIGGKGLMHPIVLREEGDGFVLVAGERRLRAIELLWMLGGVLKCNSEIINEGEIPYVTLGQLTPLEAEEAELEENLHRKDLSWQESAAAMSKLHKIRCAQAQAEGRIHTVADTAQETKGRSDGSYQETVRRELIVAKHLNNPEVAKAKTTDEAFKILRKQEESQKNIDLAVKVGKTFSKELHELHHADCIDWMGKCEKELFDVILTDPPYGLNADQFGDGGKGRLTNNEHHYSDTPEEWRELMKAWCPLSFKVAKAQAHAYVFCDLDNFHELKGLMQLSGWYVFRTPFICTKPGSGRVPLPFSGPRRQYEMLLYAIKGQKPITAIYPDVIPSYIESNTTHGAQKPIELYVNLLTRSVRPGDVVLDCFAGSGTIFPACHQMKCKAVGIERSAEYYGLSMKRMQSVDNPTKQDDGVALGNELKDLMKQAVL